MTCFWKFCFLRPEVGVIFKFFTRNISVFPFFKVLPSLLSWLAQKHILPDQEDDTIILKMVPQLRLLHQFLSGPESHFPYSSAGSTIKHWVSVFLLCLLSIHTKEWGGSELQLKNVSLLMPSSMARLCNKFLPRTKLLFCLWWKWAEGQAPGFSPSLLWWFNSFAP